MEAGKRRLAGATVLAANTDEVRDLRREARDLKEVVAEQTLEMRLLKESMIADWGDDECDSPHPRSWRSSGWSRKAICLPKQTLDRLGIARPTFYRWYDLYQRFGEDALEDRRLGPRRAWNRIPEKVPGQILEMALERCELSPRELAVTFTDEQSTTSCPRPAFTARLRRMI